MRSQLVFLTPLMALALAQHVAVKPPKEPSAAPRGTPEPRRQILAPPATILSNLLSVSRETRRLAYQQLGLPPGDFDVSEPLDDARLLMVNLDEDDELEAILIYTVSRKLSDAVVLDKDNDGWWVVGGFFYWWHWTADKAERLIELREIVWPGHKDIVVRTGSGGTGVVRTDLSVYRLHRRQLYRVFGIAEETEYAAVGEPGVDAYSDRNEVRFYEGDAAGPPAIVVRRTKTAFPSKSSVAASVKTLGCTAYAWDAAGFVFSPDGAVATRLCGGK